MQALQILLVVLVILMSSAAKVSAQFIPVNASGSDTIVVFVHGFTGTPQDTFTHPGSPSWAHIMKSDNALIRNQRPLASYDTAYLGYPTGAAIQLTIPALANRLLQQLQDAGAFDRYEKIVIIAHSMGGLVTKEMWKQSILSRHSFANKLHAIFLFGVPSLGVDMGRFVKLVAQLAGARQVLDLQSIDSNTFIKSMEDDWQDSLRSRSARSNAIRFPRIYCAYENRATTYLGINWGRIVPQTSAATPCDERAEEIEADHIYMVKPTNSSDHIYEWVRGRIADLSLVSGASSNHGPTLQLDSASALITATVAGGGSRGNIGGPYSQSTAVTTGMTADKTVRVSRTGTESSDCQPERRVLSEGQAAALFKDVTAVGAELYINLYARGGEYKTGGACVAGFHIGGDSHFNSAVAKVNIDAQISFKLLEEQSDIVITALDIPDDSKIIVFDAKKQALKPVKPFDFERKKFGDGFVSMSGRAVYQLRGAATYSVLLQGYLSAEVSGYGKREGALHSVIEIERPR